VRTMAMVVSPREVRRASVYGAEETADGVVVAFARKGLFRSRVWGVGEGPAPGAEQSKPDTARWVGRTSGPGTKAREKERRSDEEMTSVGAQTAV